MKNPPPHPVRSSRFQRLVHELRTEAGSRGQQAAGIGIGVFIGCLPIWGLHLAICAVVGKLLRLNRVKMYLAANISNPLLAPLLLIAAVQVGALTRRGDLYGLGWEEWRHVDPASFGYDLVIGSILVGAVLGGVAAALTWMLARPRTEVHELLAQAADRYLPAGITAWEFARNKLRSDPLYAEVLFGGHLPASGRLVDIGCGQGLLLAALATARHAYAHGHWPANRPAPPLLELHGFDRRQRAVDVARIALGADASITCGDARTESIRQCDAIAICDVLHLMSRAEQDALLPVLVEALAPGGVLLVREADAGASWRFRMVKAVNFLRGLAQGRWPAFAFRTASEWMDALAGADLCVDAHAAGAGTPFANVLFVARKAAASPARPGESGAVIARS